MTRDDGFAASARQVVEDLRRFDHAERLAEALREVVRLRALINSPIVDDFVEGVRIEAAHQCERWGDNHDAVKSPDDWFWTLGHLAGKARAAASAGDPDRLRHHLITSAALLANWHRHASGEGGS